MTKSFTTSAIAAAALALSATASFAQSSETGAIQAPVTNLPSSNPTRSFPALFGAPSAVAPRGGSGFVGLSYVNPRGGVSGNGADGSVSAGYTIGNPIENVSLTFGVAITGTNPFGDSGSLSLTASRLLGAGGNSATFVGASAYNLAGWGDAEATDEAYSVYVSHLVGIPSAGGEIPMQFTVGYATDNVRSSDGLGTLDDGLFAGLGVGLTQNLSAGISLNETQVNMGLTVTIPDTPVSVTAGVYDVMDNTDRQQFGLSVGFGF